PAGQIAVRGHPAAAARGGGGRGHPDSRVPGAVRGRGGGLGGHLPAADERGTGRDPRVGEGHAAEGGGRVAGRAPAPTHIAGGEALADFRRGLTGPRAFELLRQASGRLLVQLAVGVGKTVWLVQIVEHALAVGEHDLVVVFVPRWDVLKELV